MVSGGGFCSRTCEFTYDMFIASITPPFNDNCMDVDEAVDVLDYVFREPVKESTFNMCM
jgi:hypothetical protein